MWSLPWLITRLLALDGVRDDLSRCIDQEFKLADDSLGQAYIINHSFRLKRKFSVINQL